MSPPLTIPGKTTSNRLATVGLPVATERPLELSRAASGHPDGPIAPANPQDATRTFWVETTTEIGDVEKYVAAWQDLSEQAIDPNPFYEPWNLIPAWRNFGAEAAGAKLVLIWRRDPRPNQPATLTGFLPLTSCRRFGWFPARYLRMWQHEYCCYCVPLLRRGVERDALHALFDWMSDSHERAIEFHHVAADGDFHKALIDVTNARAARRHSIEVYNRAMLQAAQSADEYTSRSMTNKHRQELRRQHRRLGELGTLETRWLAPDDSSDAGGSSDTGSMSIDAWIETFLDVEKSGWKEEENTALGCRPETRAYFETICRAAHRSHKLMMLGLFLNGKPVAVKCNFLSGVGGYTFKIGYDHSLSKYSPGVLLEVENIRLVHEHGLIRWLDSCAVPNHPMIDRIWSERRTIQKVLVSSGSWRGNALIEAISALTGLRGLLKRHPQPTTERHQEHPAGSENNHRQGVIASDAGVFSVAERWTRKNQFQECVSQESKHMRQSSSASQTLSAINPLVKSDQTLLEINPQRFVENFNRLPFMIGHRLTDHPLFELPRLLELARRLPESQIEYNAGNLPVNQDQALTPRNGLSIEETIRRIEECKSWLVLKHVQFDPEYSRLLHDCLAEVKPFSEKVVPGMQQAYGFIFITSPGSVTPYHMDPEHNFLLQVHGDKTVHLFDGRDRSIVTEQDLERFYGTTTRNMTLSEENKSKAMTFLMKPGDGLHFPVTYPHWVQNMGDVSVSFSITFRTPDLERRNILYGFNRRLRERGFHPTPVGVSPLKDAIKFQSYRLWRKSCSLIGKKV